MFMKGNIIKQYLFILALFMPSTLYAEDRDDEVIHALTRLIVNGACYAREYSEEHFKSHPNQWVSFISLAQQTEGIAGNLTAQITVKFREEDEYFHHEVACYPEGKGSRCRLDYANAGYFYGRFDSDGALIIDFTNAAPILLQSQNGKIFQGVLAYNYDPEPIVFGNHKEDQEFKLLPAPFEACHYKKIEILPALNLDK
jgi:hypothetical protein